MNTEGDCRLKSGELMPWEDPERAAYTKPPPPGTEDVAFVANFDGTEQRYVLVPPGGVMPTDAVDVLFTFHGHGGTRWQFVTETQWERRATRDIAKERGMLLVAPDYRACTSWMGPAAEADTLQIIDELRKRFNVRHIFFSGASMGGTATLTLAARHPEIASGLVALNPLANHLSYENFQDAIAASFGGSKAEKFAEYKERSALFYPENFKVPISVTVGGRDDVVPPESVTELCAAIHSLHPELVYFDACPWRIHMTNYEDSLRAFREMFNRFDSQGK